MLYYIILQSHRHCLFSNEKLKVGKAGLEGMWGRTGKNREGISYNQNIFYETLIFNNKNKSKKLLLSIFISRHIKRVNSARLITIH